MERLWDNTRYFQGKRRDLGFDLGATVTPITPVMIGDAKKAQDFSRALYEHGIFGMAISYPTVPKGKDRIRLMNSATHSQEDLDFALGVFEKVGKQMGLIS